MSRPRRIFLHWQHWRWCVSRSPFNAREWLVALGPLRFKVGGHNATQ